MSEEIKLGWYRRQLGGQPIQIEVVFTAPGQAVLKSSTGSLFVWDAETIRQNYDYIGTELGEWVSPDEVTIGEMQKGIKARVRASDQSEWQEGLLTDVSARPTGMRYLAEGHLAEGLYTLLPQCQVWRAKK